MRCIKCNSDIPSNAKFCPKCGTKVEISERPAEVEKPTDVIICPKCGTSYPLTAKFCRKDGTPLQKVPPPVTEIKKPEVTEKEIKPEATVEPELKIPMEVKTEEKPPEPEAVIEPKVSLEEKPPEKIPEVEKQKDVIICPKCGTENPLTAKFCKKDGTSLKEEIKPIKVPEPEVKPEVAIQPKIKEAAPPKVEVKKEEAKRPSKTWIWIAVCGLILIIAGVGSYLYFSGQIGKKPTEVTAGPEVTKPPESPKAPEEVEKPTSPQESETEIVSPPAEPAKPSVDIARVERDLNSTLKNRGLYDVYAKVNNDLVATLKGTVNDPRDKMLASNITESFKEIKSVKNEISVSRLPASVPPAERPAEPPAPAPAPPPIIKIDPAKLEGDINRALRNAGLRGVTAEVSDDLQVTLKGSVSSAAEKDKAFEIAKTFKDAKRIRDVIFVVEQ